MTNSCVVLSENDSTCQFLYKAISRLNHFKIDGFAFSEEEAFGLLFEHFPQIIFYEVSKTFPWSFLSELHRYFKDIPSVIVIAPESDMQMALDYGTAGFVSNLIEPLQIQKTLMRWHRNKEIIQLSNVQNHQLSEVSLPVEPFQNEISQLQQQIQTLHQQLEQLVLKANQSPGIPEKLLKDLLLKMEEMHQTTISKMLPQLQAKQSNEAVKEGVICVKSYGDYKFINLEQILYLKADNNSTDITLKSGEIITAFKTLKYFVEQLPDNFHRVHNSYIVNMLQISRIHLGNFAIYLKDSKLQIPFSKSYKDKVEELITLIVGEVDATNTSDENDHFSED
ncbi:MAG: LytR/AlgR family response regulator transcription factor [Flavobacterium sp.]